MSQVSLFPYDILSVQNSLTKWTSASTERLSEYSRVVVVEGGNFKQITDDLSAHLSLSSELRAIEMVMVDSMALMASSDLEAKDVIVAFLSNFSADARGASRRLQKLTSRVGGVVDMCV